jgi:hypothetical protein
LEQPGVVRDWRARVAPAVLVVLVVLVAPAPESASARAAVERLVQR